MSIKNPNENEKKSKKSKEPKSNPKIDQNEKGEEEKKSKITIPKEWKDKDSGKDLDKGQRRTLISTLRRSASVKVDKPTTQVSNEPMNIVITLSPAKHSDIIEYLDETVPAGGRAEWVRDSIRLKMRIERGVYGINTSGQDTEGTLQTVFGQFAEVMTKVMTDIRSGQQAPRDVVTQPSKQISVARDHSSEPPKLKKVETSDKKKEEIKPERPNLDDAIGAIIVVE